MHILKPHKDTRYVYGVGIGYKKKKNKKKNIDTCNNFTYIHKKHEHTSLFRKQRN